MKSLKTLNKVRSSSLFPAGKRARDVSTFDLTFCALQATRWRVGGAQCRSRSLVGPKTSSVDDLVHYNHEPGRDVN
jgi:hypothetical protein